MSDSAQTDASTAPAGSGTPGQAPATTTAPTGTGTPPAPTTPAPPAPKAQPNAPKTGPTVSKIATNAPKTTVAVPEIGENVTIKVIKPHHELGAFAGDVTTASPTLAARLVAGGYASLTTETPQAALVTPTAEQLVQAKAAYARYGAVTDFKNFQGNPMPEFEKLPEAIQCAWAAVANLEYSHKAE